MNTFTVLISLTSAVALTAALYCWRNARGESRTFEFYTSSELLNIDKLDLLDTLGQALTAPGCTKATLTQEERSLHIALEQAITGRYRVFCKFRLEKLVYLSMGVLPIQYKNMHNRINEIPVDYLVCELPDNKVVGVVMMVNSGEDDYKKINFRQLLLSADIPVASFIPKSEYPLAEVRSVLSESFPLSLISDKHYKDTSFRLSEPPLSVSPIANRGKTVTADQICPTCLDIMIKRQVAKGPHKGKFFWACSNYPSCRQLLAINETEESGPAVRTCIDCGAEMVNLRVKKGPHAGKLFWVCSTYPECKHMTA